MTLNQKSTPIAAIPFELKIKRHAIVRIELTAAKFL